MTGRIDVAVARAHQPAWCAAMGDPQHAYPVIHVTGTNGKGSTAQMITRLLMAQGLTVGTYTSPHLERVNERIARDAEPIDDDDFAEQIAAIADLEGLTGVRPSYFEAVHRGRLPLVRRRRRRRRGRRGRAARSLGRHQRRRRAGRGRHQHRAWTTTSSPGRRSPTSPARRPGSSSRARPRSSARPTPSWSPCSRAEPAASAAAAGVDFEPRTTSSPSVAGSSTCARHHDLPRGVRARCTAPTRATTPSIALTAVEAFFAAPLAPRRGRGGLRRGRRCPVASRCSATSRSSSSTVPTTRRAPTRARRCSSTTSTRGTADPRRRHAARADGDARRAARRRVRRRGHVHRAVAAGRAGRARSPRPLALGCDEVLAVDTVDEACALRRAVRRRRRRRARRRLAVRRRRGPPAPSSPPALIAVEPASEPSGRPMWTASTAGGAVTPSVAPVAVADPCPTRSHPRPAQARRRRAWPRRRDPRPVRGQGPHDRRPGPAHARRRHPRPALRRARRQGLLRRPRRVHEPRPGRRARASRVRRTRGRSCAR